MSPTSSAIILTGTARTNLFNFVTLPLGIKELCGPAAVNRLDVRIMVGGDLACTFEPRDE
jgi:hypothetical protein